MTMIDDIKRDREFGTKGAWVKVSMSTEISDASGTYIGRCASGSTNARRIARVPDMEAALIAADDMQIWLSGCLNCNNFNWDADQRIMADETLAAYRKATGAV